jgi:hypothetical protein
MTLRQSVELALARLGGNPRLLTAEDVRLLMSVDRRIGLVAERVRASAMPCSPSPTLRPSSSSSEAA